MDGFYILVFFVAITAMTLEKLGGDKWWGDIKPKKNSHTKNSMMPITKRLKPTLRLRCRKWIRDLFR